MSGQIHVSGLIIDAIFWVRDNIIEELFDKLICVFRGHRLLGSNFAESDKEFGIDGYVILQQGNPDELNLFDAFFIKFGAVVGVGRVLGLGTIVDFAMFVW